MVQNHDLGDRTITLWKWRRADDGFGTVRVNAGTRSGRVVADIDLKLLAKYYADRALSNKSGKSQLLQGAVVLRSVGVEDTKRERDSNRVNKSC